MLVGMREVRNEDGTKTVHSLLLSSLPYPIGIGVESYSVKGPTK